MPKDEWIEGCLGSASSGIASQPVLRLRKTIDKCPKLEFVVVGCLNSWGLLVQSGIFSFIKLGDNKCITSNYHCL